MHTWDPLNWELKLDKWDPPSLYVRKKNASLKMLLALRYLYWGKNYICCSINWDFLSLMDKMCDEIICVNLYVHVHSNTHANRICVCLPFSCLSVCEIQSSLKFSIILFLLYSTSTWLSIRWTIFCDRMTTSVHLSSVVLYKCVLSPPASLFFSIYLISFRTVINAWCYNLKLIFISKSLSLPCVPTF